MRMQQAKLSRHEESSPPSVVVVVVVEGAAKALPTYTSGGGLETAAEAEKELMTRMLTGRREK